ncbi:MAG: DUF4013 domain-containing protein [Haloarculaceae archaeon]
MLGRALSFPVSGTEGGKTYVLGGLTVAGLVVGNLLAAGGLAAVADATTAERAVEPVAYGLLVGGGLLGVVCYLLLAGVARRLLATAARGERRVPAFGRVPTLLADGVRVLAVKAAYLLPAVVLGSLSAGLAEAPLTGTARVVSRSAAALALLVCLLYLVVLFYVVPAAVTMFAVEDSLRAAFDLGRLRTAVISEDYAVGWVGGTVLVGVGGLVGLGLVVVLVGVFALFHVGAAGRYCYGTAVGRALGYADRDDAAETDTGPDTEQAPAAVPGEDPMAAEIRRRY